MSKARLVITAVVAEGRSQGRWPGRTGCPGGWVGTGMRVRRRPGRGPGGRRPRRAQSRTPLFLSDSSGVALISFETASFEEFLHVDFLPNNTARIDDVGPESARSPQCPVYRSG